MKATLEYDLPEDSEAFNVASKATDLYLVLWELDQLLMYKVKHGEGLSEDVYKAYDLLREKIRDMLFEHGCSLDMMS